MGVLPLVKHRIVVLFPNKVRTKKWRNEGMSCLYAPLLITTGQQIRHVMGSKRAFNSNIEYHTLQKVGCYPCIKLKWNESWFYNLWEWAIIALINFYELQKRGCWITVNIGSYFACSITLSIYSVISARELKFWLFPISWGDYCM